MLLRPRKTKISTEINLYVIWKWKVSFESLNFASNVSHLVGGTSIKKDPMSPKHDI